MQLHEIRPLHKTKNGNRIGRGGRRGTYSGKGVKGQKSRAGRKMMPMIREIIKRYPKLKGYKYHGIAKDLAVLNVETLEKWFSAGEVVNPENLLKKEIVRRIKGKAPNIKILSNGDIKKALVIEGCKVSAKAKEKIEKAGGTIK
jgi:large subunit ribosomal protein L15